MKETCSCPDPLSPTVIYLDQILPDNPAVLYRVGGHTAWLNSMALELAGIDKTTDDPDGGKIVRDFEGEPTGIRKKIFEEIGDFSDDFVFWGFEDQELAYRVRRLPFF